MRVAVVTVLYRSAGHVRAWADALERAWAEVASEGHELQAVAVENASGDDAPAVLAAHAPWVSVIEQAENRGFAAGCNAALRAVAPDALVVVLNPDVTVAPGFFRRLLALDWPPGLGARGPLVLNPDGSVEQSARRFPTLSTGVFGRTSVFARWFPRSRLVQRELRADPAQPREVDWVSGACMIAPRNRFDRVGGFDEGYFMYWEDADWCRRARDAGYSIAYEPALEVVHTQGSSSASRPMATTIAFHRSAARYYRRHVAHGRAGAAASAALLAARCAVKLTTLALRRAAAHGRGAARSAPRS